MLPHNVRTERSSLCDDSFASSAAARTKWNDGQGGGEMCPAGKEKQYMRTERFYTYN